MEIRTANFDDIAKIAQLKNTPDQERYIKRVDQLQEGKAEYLILEEGGEIIGQAFLKYYGTLSDPDYPDIEDIYIKEQFRGQGLGTLLIKKCEGLAKQKGFKKIGLGVNPTLNSKAKALYERLGYDDVGREPRLDGIYNGVEDWTIDMVKNLE